MPRKKKYQKEYQKKYRQRNRKKLNAYTRKWRLLNKELWKEIQTKSRAKHKDTIKEERRRYYRKHWEKVRARANQYNKLTARKAREQVLQLFGGKCQRCGFSDKRALQIDHKNGGGSKHSRSFGNLYLYYQHVLKVGAKNFQLLCANCNWIKRVERGEAPGTVAKLKGGR